MTKSNAFLSNCPIAKVTQILGEPWTLLVIREAFLGTRQFGAFERELGIARNILSDRLKKLVDHGLLKRQPSTSDKRVVEYRLTEAGRELTPVLVGLTQWSKRWLCDETVPLRFVERRNGRTVPPVAVRNADGEALDPRDIAMVAGPDADEVLIDRFARLGS